MATCDVCGKEENMPYDCRHCGGTYCGEHRLPENHSCTGLENWDDPSGVFDSGFDDSVNSGSSSRSSAKSKVTSKLPFDTGRSGILGYFRGNMTYTILALIWLTMAAQFLSYLIGGLALHNALFTISTENPEYVWTWVTSIFAHSPFFVPAPYGGTIFHIIFNSIVIFFFGPLVERYIGSRDFAILFVVSGVLAGIGQIGLAAVFGLPSSVLGASGAALAIMGVVTILNPDLRVYLFFVLAMPIWVIAAGTVAISLLFILLGNPGAGNIAHGAHLVGILIGLAYGEYLKRTQNIRMPNQLQMGGGGPGGPGGPGRGRGPF